MLKLWSLAGRLLILTGCAAAPAVSPGMLQLAGMTSRQLAVDGFVLQSYVRLPHPDRPIRVYIEGDGHAWATRWEPAVDPTPRHAIGLQLALLDPLPNVIYLARPCQYTRQQSPACNAAYWTDKRYSSEVVTAMNQALDQLLQAIASPQLELVGYSGGAAIAVMLAARRHDVISLRSVAGNLDSEAVNRFHQVSAMPLSQNPIDDASSVAHLPQRHFIGGRDRVIPPSISAGFLMRTACRVEGSLVKVDDADHEHGWQAVWLGLLAMPPQCLATGTAPQDRK